MPTLKEVFALPHVVMAVVGAAVPTYFLFPTLSKTVALKRGECAVYPYSAGERIEICDNKTGPDFISFSWLRRRGAIELPRTFEEAGMPREQYAREIAKALIENGDIPAPPVPKSQPSRIIASPEPMN